MDRIRVLLANYPVMVPEAIRQLVTEQDDMELVAECRGPMKILQETGRAQADAVILSLEGSEELGLCSQLLAVYPDLTILCVPVKGETVYSQNLRVSRQAVRLSHVRDITQVLRTLVRKQIENGSDPCLFKSATTQEDE